MTQVKNPDRIPYPRFQVRRRITRFFTRGLMRLLTRITVEGIDNIPVRVLLFLLATTLPTLNRC